MNQSTIKAVALVAALVPGAPASAQTAQGMPYLSDGTTDLSISVNGGVFGFNVCGRDYFIETDYGLQVYKGMRDNLLSSGYIWYNTDDQYKKWYACGWGRFDHLTQVLQ